MITLGSASALAPEDIGLFPLFVTRSGPAEVAASVTVATQGANGAAAPFDFGAPRQSQTPGGTPVAGHDRRTSRPGETIKTVFIPIVNDDNEEGTEIIDVRINTPTGGAAIGFPHDTIVAIPANDPSTPTPEPTLGGGHHRHAGQRHAHRHAR